MKTVFIIHCHREAIPVIERHIPVWRRFSDDILFVSPASDPVHIEGFSTFVYGVPGHHNMSRLKRYMEGLMAGLRTFGDTFVILEYDAMLLKKVPDSIHGAYGFFGIVFKDGDRRWSSENFIHPPYIVGRETLQKFCDEANLNNPEEGFSDRYMTAELERLGIPYHDLSSTRDGFSRNTIEMQHYSDFSKALQGGAWAIHGIKDEVTLGMALAKI